MASGVTVDKDCVTKFWSLKLGDLRYIIFKLSDDNTKMVVEEASSDAVWDNFRDTLTAKGCRYATYNYRSTTVNKLIFISWRPDGVKINEKMIYASLKGTLKDALGTMNVELTIDSSEDLDEETVLNKIK